MNEVQFMNNKKFTSTIKALKVNDIIYINAINLNVRQIDFLRKLIKEGTLTPDREELDKMIVESAHPKFISGECIAPQMTYVKVR